MKTTVKIAIFAILAFTLFNLSVFASNQNKDIEGKWEGTLLVSGTSLRIVFNVSKNSTGRYVATMDSPDQGAWGIKVDKTVFDGEKVVFEINSINGRYEGAFKGDEIGGTWEQRTYSFPLSLRRMKSGAISQSAVKHQEKYPYIIKDVTFKNKSAGVTLAGTLTLPKKGGPFPAVILITGSGPQDRNETVFGHKPFLVIADYLTRRGIAVLRYDDRGVGKSTGDFSKSTTEDFARDVICAVNYLKEQKNIDSKKIGLIGHSEGGLIAPMVAVRDSDIAFIVLMAGPGLTGSEILDMQSRLILKTNGKKEKTIDEYVAINDKVFDVLKMEKDSSKAYEQIKTILRDFVKGLSSEEKKEIGDEKKFVNRQIAAVMSPWFRYFVNYDPKPTLERVKCPVLAIGGSKDLQVPAKANLDAIREALQAGGNKNFEVKEFKGLNHLFQHAKTGSPSEYAKIKETIAPEVLKIIGDWIVKQVK